MKISIRNLKYSIASLLLVATFTLLGTASAVRASAVDVIEDSCNIGGNANSALCKNNDKELFGPDSIFTNIVNTVIFVIGAIAVVMIVIGGLRYTLSGGDSGSLTSAKNTILYAIIGLVIAVMSYGIVNFVLAKI